MLLVILSSVVIQTHALLTHNIEDVIPGQYIVGLKNSEVSSQSVIASFKTTCVNVYGARVIKSLRIGGLTVSVISASEETVSDLLNLTYVSYIEPNYIVKGFEASSSGYHKCYEYDVRSTWNLDRLSHRRDNGQGTFTISDADNGTGVDVYVLDTGIAIEHLDFDGRAKYSFKASGLDPEDEYDNHGHGTHVAGIIGSNTYGVAKNVNLLSVKVLDRNNKGSLDGIEEGIQHVVNEFQFKKVTTGQNPKFICNLSLGFVGTSLSLESAITEAIDLGINFVIAAGNFKRDACETSPARVRTAVTVAASDKDDSLASFSNYGSCIDIISPGIDILSTYPSGTRVLHGTSQAAPAVAGVMARILSVVESCSETVLSPAEVKGAILLASTKDAISLGTEATSTPNKLVYMSCEQALALTGCVNPDIPEGSANASCPSFNESCSYPTDEPICDADSYICCANTCSQPCLQPLHIGLIVCSCVCVCVALIAMSVCIIKREKNTCSKIGCVK